MCNVRHKVNKNINTSSPFYALVVLLKNGVKIRMTQIKNVTSIRNKELAQENAASQRVLN
jgi:hypothetical protein